MSKKMKLRVLTNTGKGKMLALAKAMSDEYSIEREADKIDPAYPCENERLVVIFLTAANKYTDVFKRFCKSLSKNIAQNVALVVDGDAAKVAPVVEWIKEAGAHVCEDFFMINGGLPFKFVKKYTAEEKEAMFAWVDKTVQSFKA